jgi:hypothetical protein
MMNIFIVSTKVNNDMMTYPPKGLDWSSFAFNLLEGGEGRRH